MWILRREWDKPNDTPELICNESISAHIVLSVSRILNKYRHEKLLSQVKGCSRKFLFDFSSDDTWITHSRVTGLQKADPYMTALILRS